MRRNETRRKFLIGGVTAGALALAGCATGGDDTDDEATDDDHDRDDDAADDDSTDVDDEVPAYEVWALDQGTDTIYLYEPDEDGYGGDEPFAHAETIDLNDLLDDEGPIVPHMIDYSSDYEYAAIACTAGARTLVFRTDDRELVAELDTGAGSHFAGFSPDDEYLHVDAIGEEAIVRVEADLADEDFEIVEEIDLREDETVLDAGIESGAPICHQYARDGRSLHTLGPAYGDGALVVVDHEEFAVDRAYSNDELPTNCGTVPHPTEEKFYLTAGAPSDPDEDGSGVGDYYVYDTAEDEVLVDGESTEGVDAHGFWFTPDGEELWVLNRETNDGVVVDPETDDVVAEIEAFGPEDGEDPGDSDAPDIMWSSPEGDRMYVTLRGPNPVSGAPHAATGVNPGFSVLDVESREIVHVEVPDPDDEDSDFHGIGVRPTEAFEGHTSPPY